MTYVVSKKLNQLPSVICRLKATAHNKGIALVNQIIFGSSMLRSGQIIFSPGGTFQYKILGPCCRLFDREELPWPSCSLQWHGKQPSWRRIGKRFVPDMATRKSPSYSVQMITQDPLLAPQVLTLFWYKHSPSQQDWWCSPRYRREKFQLEAALRSTPSFLRLIHTPFVEAA